MHHGVTHLDASGKPVHDEASDFVLEDRYKIRELTEILFRAMNRCSEMAFERVGDLKNLLAARVPNQKRRGAKDLGTKVRRQKCSSVSFEECGASGKTSARELLKLRQRA